MSRIIKSKIYKPFMAFLVALILVFSYEVSKPKAIVPIVIWGAGILAGVIAEEMLEMGIKHVTANGKTGKKGKAGKIADEILDSLDGYDFDNTNPTRKADGSLEVNLSANDRAKIARKIADEFGDVIEADDARTGGMSKPSYDVDTIEGDPMWNTSLDVDIVPGGTTSAYMKGYDFLIKLFNIKFEPIAYEGKTKVSFNSVVTGKELTRFTLNGGSYFMQAGTLNWTSSTVLTGDSSCYGLPKVANGSGASQTVFMDNYSCDKATGNLFINYMKAMELTGKKIHYADGLAVPSTLKNVYKVGDDYQGDALPNKTALSNKPYKIPNFFPSSESDEDVEWEIVQQHYDNDVTTNQTKIDQEIETYLEKGDINNVTNHYNTQTINNYYTDTNYPVKNADIVIDIDIDNDVVVPVDDDDGGGVADGESAPVIDRTLITYAKQTYDYLGDSIDGAIVSMRDITDDASGLVDYLDTSFRWLPAEWRALFGSAFILGVFAHFMRR